LSLVNDLSGRRMGDPCCNTWPTGPSAASHKVSTSGILEVVRSPSYRTLVVHTIDDTLAAASEQEPALLGEPFIIEQQTVSIAVRSGLGFCPNRADNANSLVQNAEAALRKTSYLSDNFCLPRSFAYPLRQAEVVEQQNVKWLIVPAGSA
jgi:hypothetical protein